MGIIGIEIEIGIGIEFPLISSDFDFDTDSDPESHKAKMRIAVWYAGELVVNVVRGYYATSSDGLTWTKYNNNIHAPSDTTSTDGRIPLGSAGGDAQHAYAPRVVRVGNEYKMWYTGRAFEVHRLYHATCPAPPYLPGGTAIKIY